MNFQNTDKSGTITIGGTSQTLFNYSANGYSIYNSDAVNDLWISESGAAVPNAAGSTRVVANGGGYESPPGVAPQYPVTVYGAITGQAFTARTW